MTAAFRIAVIADSTAASERLVASVIEGLIRWQGETGRRSDDCAALAVDFPAGAAMQDNQRRLDLVFDPTGQAAGGSQTPEPAAAETFERMNAEAEFSGTGASAGSGPPGAPPIHEIHLRGVPLPGAGTQSFAAINQGLSKVVGRIKGQPAKKTLSEGLIWLGKAAGVLAAVTEEPGMPAPHRIVFGCFGIGQSATDFQNQIAAFRQDGLNAIVIVHDLIGMASSAAPAGDAPAGVGKADGLAGRLFGLRKALGELERLRLDVMIAYEQALVPASFLSPPVDLIDSVALLGQAQAALARAKDALIWLDPLQYASSPGYKEHLEGSLLARDPGLENEMQNWKFAGIVPKFHLLDSFGIDIGRQEIASMCWRPVDGNDPAEQADSAQDRATEGYGARRVSTFALQQKLGKQRSGTQWHHRWRPFGSDTLLLSLLNCAAPPGAS